MYKTKQKLHAVKQKCNQRSALKKVKERSINIKLSRQITKRTQVLKTIKIK